MPHSTETIIVAELRYLKVGEHRMAAYPFNEDTSGIPLVFIHGITSSPNFWRFGQTEYIRQHRRWYSLTLPGHNPAVFPAGFYKGALTGEMIAQVTANAIEQLTGGQPAIVAGHSTGGFAALAVAATRPELVAGVISISGFAKGYWTGALRVLQLFARYRAEALFRANFRLLNTSSQVYWQALRVYAADVRALYSDPALVQVLPHLFADAQKLSIDSMLAYFRHMPDIDITSWLSRIHVPTLVVAGDRDPIVPHNQAGIIANQIPNSELQLLRGCGHVPMSERRDEYHALITDWVKQYA